VSRTLGWDARGYGSVLFERWAPHVMKCALALCCIWPNQIAVAGVILAIHRASERRTLAMFLYIRAPPRISSPAVNCVSCYKLVPWS